MATLMAVLLYLDRLCLSIAERFIAEEMSLSTRQIGWLLSAFFWSYALGQVPFGWLSDRFGGRRMLTIYILVWSLFTGLMGLASGFLGLLIFRLGIGVGQAGAYPTSAALIRKWMPFSSRGLASSIVSVGGRFGGFLAPIVTAYLIVAFVPVGVPSALTAEDLRDPGGLCALLLGERSAESGTADSAAEASSAALQADLSRRIWSIVPEQSKQIITDCARDHAAGRSIDATRLQGLVGALNVALTDRDLCRPDDISRMTNREKELVRLSQRPRESLSGMELWRLNRLFLEGVYSDQIKKLYGRGWRPVFLVYGVVGVLIAGLFWLFVRDQPADHPRVNAAELALISGPESSAAARQAMAGSLPVVALLSNFSLWMCCVQQFCTNLGWVFLVTWLPRYLLEAHQVPIVERGSMAAVPVFVGWFGMLGGGWLTDRLVGVVGLRWGRRLPMSISRFTAMAAYLTCLLDPSPWMAILAFSIVAFSTDIGTPSVWAFNQDIGGRYTASVLGWGNMWGNFGAAVSPVLLSEILGENGNWDGVFLASAGAFLLSGIAGLFVDATSKLVPKEE
jgi:nitrate/nitrite transporter NarK